MGLRELISNSSDALDKIRHRSLTDKSVLDGNPELYIRLVPDKSNNTLTIIDSGVSPRRTRVHHPPGASSSLGSARPSVQGSQHPTLRANPFPEVTDLFCRLPLSTLFYRPEAS